MENTIVNKAICLTLNANWQPIGYKTVKDAIINLCGLDINGNHSSLAIDIDYEVDNNGEPITEEPKVMTPISWEKWINLPIRSWDLVINTQYLKIRVPTVIIATNFNKMPMKRFKGKPSKNAIYIRDNGVCQYTNRKIEKQQATVDHILPRSRGGNNSWENLVLCAKDVNLKKGSKLNSEIGLKLNRLPSAPIPIPVCSLIRDVKHIDWKHFLIKK